jgi:Helix-turn-helix of DDE superfamily endonuclease
MILCYAHLRRPPRAFRSLTGRRAAEFDTRVAELLPAYASGERDRVQRPGRRRAIGAGHPFALAPRDQLLLTVVWLRAYPPHEARGSLFGVSATAVTRLLACWLPLLGAAGRETRRLPDPGRTRRRRRDALLADPPGAGRHRRHLRAARPAPARPRRGGRAGQRQAAAAPAQESDRHRGDRRRGRGRGGRRAGADRRRHPGRAVGALGPPAAGGRRARGPGLPRPGHAAPARGHSPAQAARARPAARGRRLQPGLRPPAHRGRAHDRAAAALSMPQPDGSAPSAAPHPARPGGGGAGRSPPPAGARLSRTARRAIPTPPG